MLISSSFLYTKIVFFYYFYEFVDFQILTKLNFYDFGKNSYEF